LIIVLVRPNFYSAGPEASHQLNRALPPVQLAAELYGSVKEAAVQSEVGRAYSKEFFGVHNFKSSCMM